jgi:hypothetical protein
MTAPSSLPGRAFRVLRRRLPALLGASLWPYLVLVGIYIVIGTIYRHTHPMYTTSDPVTLWRDFSFPAKIGVILIFVASASIPYGLAFAGVSLTVYDDYRGEESSLGSVLKRVMRRWLAVVVASFLVGCGGVFGSFMLIPGVIFTMLTVFTVPVLLLEEAGVGSALRRSMRLALDRAGSVLGLMLTFGMVVYLVVISYFGLVQALNLDDETMVWAFRGLLGVAVPMMMCLYCTMLAILYCDIRVSRGELGAGSPVPGAAVGTIST